MSVRTRPLLAGLALAAGLTSGQIAFAAPADGEEGPPPRPAPRAAPQQAGGPQDGAGPGAPGPGGPQRNGDRRPPGPMTVQRAVDELGLSDEQKQKVGPLVEEYRQKERQAREELLRQLKDVLDGRQVEQLQRSLQPGPRPPRPDGDRGPADRPPRGDGQRGDAPRDSGNAPAGASAPAPAPATAPQARAVAADGKARLAVTFTGGHETDPRDHGRPVVLVAAALGVPPEVFREAFSHVTPAGGGREPEPAQVRKNKEALMSRLGPLGVTNERLDTVSNYYRYSASRGQMWRTTPAAAYATVRDGVVTAITVTDAGSGYSSPPQVSIEGMRDVKATVTLAFGTDFATNGSVKEIKLEH